MGYNFKNREVAEELKRIAQHKMGVTNSPDVPAGNVVIFVKAPSGGITAISGTTMTSGTCTKMLINEGATDTDLDERTEIEIEVYNTTGEDIAGGSVFQAARVGEYWVSLTGGSGGGGTGQPILQFKTTTAISAGNPVDGSAGTGSANLWSFDGTAWSIDNASLYDIVNPWATTVSQGKMITAYQDTNNIDKYVLIQSECEESGGSPSDPSGYCIDDTTGAVTSGVLQSACTGTWSSTEPTTGCCDVGGTDHENVAESWCTTQGGTFSAGACAPAGFDPCPENARFEITAINIADQTVSSCASTPWSCTSTTGSEFGTAATGCTKEARRQVWVNSSENGASSTPVIDLDCVYNSGTDTWDITGDISYTNFLSQTVTVTFTGSAPNTVTACGDSVTATLNGTSAGNYYQACDSTDGTAISGTVTMTFACY